MLRAPKVVLLGVLFTALLLEAAVLYFMDDRTVRLFVGLALFLLIGWMFASSQVAEVIGSLPGDVRRRRYRKLRAQVELMLAEVRRLNWMAVDRDSGVRDRKEAVAEMDAIEERLRDLVSEIRRQAGVASDEPVGAGAGRSLRARRVAQSNAPAKMVSAGALGQGTWTASVRRLAPRSFRRGPAAARGGSHTVGRQSPRNDAR